MPQPDATLTTIRRSFPARVTGKTGMVWRVGPFGRPWLLPWAGRSQFRVHLRVWTPTYGASPEQVENKIVQTEVYEEEAQRGEEGEEFVGNVWW